MIYPCVRVCVCVCVYVCMQDPRPHVSIAWLQGSQQAAVETALATLRDERSRHGKRDFCVELVVSRVLCRVGKHDHVVWSDGSQGS